MRRFAPLTLALTVACGGNSSSPTSPPPPPAGTPSAPASITISPSTRTVHFIGAAVRLRARVLDARGAAIPNATVAWTSATPDILAVDAGGVVTALADGVGTVEASVGSARGSATVTVAHSACPAVQDDIVADLEVGESVTVRSRDVCVRVVGRATSSFYSIGVVEPSYIEGARETAEPFTGTYDWDIGDYMGGHMFVEDLGSGPVAAYAPPVPEPLAGSAQQQARDEPPHIEPYFPGDAQLRLDDPYGLPELAVGDEFEWWTDSPVREGTFQVVALYPPNIALAVFKDDLSIVWSEAKRRGLSTMFERLGSEKVQNLYKAWFGPHPPYTTESGQLIVLHHDADGNRTGVMFYNGDDPTRTHVHINRYPPYDEFDWYQGLTAHELGHAWHYRNERGVSSQWATEGLANTMANEELRVWLDLPRAAQLTSEWLEGWEIRAPSIGNFLWGYRESDFFIRYLIDELVDHHGQTYEEAAGLVIDGVTEGWHGKHYRALGRSEPILENPGLTNRMNEVVPGWDPVEARLDWMISFGADDHTTTRWQLPFIREGRTWAPPWFHVTSGEAIGSVSRWFYDGGSAYALADNPSGVNSTMRMSISTDRVTPVWKILRYR